MQRFKKRQMFTPFWPSIDVFILYYLYNNTLFPKTLHFHHIRCQKSQEKSDLTLMGDVFFLSKLQIGFEVSIMSDSSERIQGFGANKENSSVSQMYLRLMKT